MRQVRSWMHANESKTQSTKQHSHTHHTKAMHLQALRHAKHIPLCCCCAHADQKLPAAAVAQR